MKLCILSPTGGLERYSKLNDVHLVLPQVKNERYWKFYEWCREWGDFIILDNGAYETKYAEWVNVYPYIGLLRPDVVSLPDAIGEPWQYTWEQTKDWIRQYDQYRQMFLFEWMFIPQTTDKNMRGFIDCLSRGLSDDRIKWIGLPRALIDRYSDDPLIRVEMCRLCIQAGKKVHALGFGSNLSEWKLLSEAGCSSLDTSAPVWRGWNSYRIDDVHDQVAWRRDGIQCDFETNDCPEPNSETDKLIMHNLEVFDVDTTAGSKGRTASNAGV